MSESVERWPKGTLGIHDLGRYGAECWRGSGELDGFKEFHRGHQALEHVLVVCGVGTPGAQQFPAVENRVRARHETQCLQCITQLATASQQADGGALICTKFGT